MSKMFAYTSNNAILIPDLEIKEDKPEYVYVPLRGYAASLAVYDINDNVIGWIDVRKLGYENAMSWMSGTGWKDQGY